MLLPHSVRITSEHMALWIQKPNSVVFTVKKAVHEIKVNIIQYHFGFGYTLILAHQSEFSAAH